LRVTIIILPIADFGVVGKIIRIGIVTIDGAIDPVPILIDTSQGNQSVCWSAVAGITCAITACIHLVDIGDFGTVILTIGD